MELSFTQQFLSTVFIIGIGTFVLVSCGAYIGYAAAKLGSADENKATLPFWLFAIIGVWFGAAIAASTGNIISIELVLPFMLFPISLGLALSYTSRVKALLRAIPTRWLIGVQAYRMAGGIFIFPYMTEGILSRGFAMNAGIGDILTGVLAIPVAILVYRNPTRWRWAFYAWTVLGIGDLIVANISANVFGFNVAGVAPTFPITSIPLFYGPALGILMHVITVRNFHLRYGKPASQNVAVALSGD